MVAIACFERRKTAALCLPTLAAAFLTRDRIVLFDDGSTEYDSAWLQQFGDETLGCVHMGIEAQRRLHLKLFWKSDADLLYFSDHDCILDPGLRQTALRIQGEHAEALCCFYNTAAHTKLPGNTLRDDPASEVIWRRFAPGCSYLLSRDLVARIMPHVDRLTAFDWDIPTILGNRCAISRTSWIDHIGFGGLRHPPSEGPEKGDLALHPTPFLIAKRTDIIAKLINGI